MIKFKSGRKVFFENIVSVQQEGDTLTLILTNKERVQLKNLSEEKFMQQRKEYFSEMYTQGTITADFGNKVVNTLNEELKTAIETLQVATIAYETSAGLANKASEVIANTSTTVEQRAQDVFSEATAISKRAANEFKGAIGTDATDKVDIAVKDLADAVRKLESELEYIEE